MKNTVLISLCEFQVPTSYGSINKSNTENLDTFDTPLNLLLCGHSNKIFVNICNLLFTVQEIQGACRRTDNIAKTVG